LRVYTVAEGKSAVIDLPAEGNPPEIDYAWTLPRNEGATSNVVQRKHALHITSASRAHDGNYTVVAVNSYGDFRSQATVRLDVWYAPR